MSPVLTSHFSDNAFVTPRIVCIPAKSINAVPSTGSRAAVPGNGVVGVKIRMLTSNIAAPTIPAATAKPWGMRFTNVPANATTAPAANSHARVGAEKNATWAGLWI